MRFLLFKNSIVLQIILVVKKGAWRKTAAMPYYAFPRSGSMNLHTFPVFPIISLF